MPELPEVQTIVNELNAAGLAGATIVAARVYWPRTIAGLSAPAFCRRLRGKSITAIRRRGKYIVVDFSDGASLLIHLRMSGRLRLAAEKTPRQKHEHVILVFDGHRQLHFHDTRKFGRLQLVREAGKVLDRLGLEPLDPAFTARALAARLERHRRLLKPLLLDQTCIAGLGNIYTDEALWEAKLHPCRSSASLSASEIKGLQRAIRRVLKRGLENLGTSLGTGQANFYSVAGRRGRNSDALRVFRRTGLACPRCKAPIERIIVGQRSTHLCRRCQKPPT